MLSGYQTQDNQINDVQAFPARKKKICFSLNRFLKEKQSLSTFLAGISWMCESLRAEAALEANGISIGSLDIQLNRAEMRAGTKGFFFSASSERRRQEERQGMECWTCGMSLEEWTSLDSPLLTSACGFITPVC
ncbi:Hypothetical predicted protein [Pelobates cultripes]|uniref:Uncharacterized protein n=1 Tax=Pelobates cultripes TaxID=61616 RepID=A0AAD1STP9_PELCU|nr:Hypothetical predicted protein [Pelobates cultripes]